MLIGLSVSGCIREMAEGKVLLDQVAYIIGGIDPGRNGENIDGIVEGYNESYWRHTPAAEVLFREMFEQGRVICPRQNTDGDILGNLLLVASGRWLACEQIDRVEEYYGSPEWM
jgi:hypothetical protein